MRHKVTLNTAMPAVIIPALYELQHLLRDSHGPSLYLGWGCNGFDLGEAVLYEAQGRGFDSRQLHSYKRPPESLTNDPVRTQYGMIPYVHKTVA